MARERTDCLVLCKLSVIWRYIDSSAISLPAAMDRLLPTIRAVIIADTHIVGHVQLNRLKQVDARVRGVAMYAEGERSSK